MSGLNKLSIDRIVKVKVEGTECCEHRNFQTETLVKPAGKSNGTAYCGDDSSKHPTLAISEQEMEVVAISKQHTPYLSIAGESPVVTIGETRSYT